MKAILQPEHGGQSKNKRKTSRPLNLDRPILLILRSERAKGDWSLLQPVHQKRIQRLLGFYAARFSIQIVKKANFGRQIQIIVKAKTRQSFQNFLRGLSGTLALEITGARRGVSHGKFWDFLAYSRVLQTVRETKETLKSVVHMLLEPDLTQNLQVSLNLPPGRRPLIL